MLQLMEAAKMMSLSGPILPKWLQGNPGGCWAILIQAAEWQMSPIAVARMSYEVSGTVAYMAQLIHAVIERRAPLVGRLRPDYEGEGEDRVCVVTGTLRGDEGSPLVLRTPKKRQIKPQNSPLWQSDPDQQLWYYGSRAWCRRFCPDVLLGLYDKDEISGALPVEPAKPSIADRLPGPGGSTGFQIEHIERETAVEPASGPAVSEGGLAPASADPPASPEPAKRRPRPAKEKPQVDPEPKPEPPPAPPVEAPMTGVVETLVEEIDPSTGEIMPPAAEPAPTGLTDFDRIKLRAFHTACGLVMAESSLKRTFDTFRQSNEARDGTVFEAGITLIYAAHKARVNGEGSPSDADIVFQKVIAP